MRERYEDWLDDRLGVLRHSREMSREMAAAQAKRERKAAKRRRDAERTVAGQRARRGVLQWLCALERLVRKAREVQP